MHDAGVLDVADDEPGCRESVRGEKVMRNLERAISGLVMRMLDFSDLHANSI